jgi:hypothetical protein
MDCPSEDGELVWALITVLYLNFPEIPTSYERVQHFLLPREMRHARRSVFHPWGSRT